MAVLDQVTADRYALFNGDCIETMGGLKDQSIHMSAYSPPFCGLWHYSSSDRDLSNCRSYEEFFDHYSFVVQELLRITLPGRIAAVHCMDVPGNGANLGGNTTDFPGDIIRLHQKIGWHWACRHHVWKDPLAVRNRTMTKSLMHSQLVEDSSLCQGASADQLLIFRKPGENPIPVAHPTGLSEYLGARTVPPDLMKYRNWKGKQTENRLSHWIFRQYMSSFWDDVRLDRVLPYKEARDAEDERHCHPLQMDVIERCVILYSNKNEKVFTPFMGVGSEVVGAVLNNRLGVGVELKNTYFRQAVKNVKWAIENAKNESKDQFLFDMNAEEEVLSQVGGLT